MTIFLTGGTGFLGSRVAFRLMDEGHEVRALRRGKSLMDLHAHAEKIDWIEGDVLDPESLMKGMEGVHAVIHCAAHLGFAGRRSESTLNDVNVLGTAHVVDSALRSGVDRLVHTSSIAALGRTSRARKPLDESAVWQRSRFNTRYAVSKHMAEMEVHRSVAEGLDAVIVNPSLVMGPGRKGENTMLIAERLASGAIPFLPSGGTNVVDVDDVAAGICKALSRGETGQRYILSGENLTWKEILETLAISLGVPAPSRTLPSWLMSSVAGVLEFTSRLSGGTPVITRETVRVSSSHTYYDNTRARTQLGCTFRPFTETANRISVAMGRPAPDY